MTLLPSFLRPSTFCGFVSSTPTRAPSLRNVSTTPRPIPEPPPVTKATLPSNQPIPLDANSWSNVVALDRQEISKFLSISRSRLIQVQHRFELEELVTLSIQERESFLRDRGSDDASPYLLSTFCCSGRSIRPILIFFDIRNVSIEL